MSDTILEREEPEAPTPEPEEVKETPEASPETETKAEEQPEQTPEAEVEVDGQRYKVTQIKEWQEAAKNRDQWQKSNTLKAQEIAAKRKALEEAEALYNVLKANPDKLQKVFAPEPERDFDSELKAHYGKRPQEYGDDYIQWEYNRDKLVAERAADQAFKRAETQEIQRSAKEHNESLANSAYDKYHEKVNDTEYQEMAGWLVTNIQPKNGKFPDNAFDVAYKVLFGDRDMESAKVNAVKAVSEQIRKAKPASGETGKLKTPEQKQPGDEEDDAFEQAVHERYPRVSK